MSVKMMTTDQLHNDLASIHNMWSGGIPTEQQDRVNALKAELKRRGVEQKPISTQPETMVVRGIEGMTNEQLSKELRDIGERIGKNPGDESLQEQFANVRFELRKRSTKEAAQTPPSPPVTGNFDPVTGETFLQQQAKPTNGSTTEMPRRDLDALRVDFAERHQANQRTAEEMFRKHTLANLAATVTAGILAKFGDPNGDDVENACVIGIQVAQSITTKIGL